MPNLLDLHMHSNVSLDGQYSPEELMSLCRKAGVATVALTDHNSIRGIPLARQAALELGLRFIPGIELDCLFRGINLHLLGYGIELTPALAAVEEKNLEKERAVSDRRIELIRGLGIHLEGEALQALSREGIATGEMIAEVALAGGNVGNPLLTPYRPGEKRGDNPYVNFYWDFCSQGKPAYLPVEYMSLAEAIGLVRKAGGLPVLAHPGINIGRDISILEGICGEGIEGIEVYSSYHDGETVGFYRAQAEKRGLLKTLGSDFHGKTKPAVRLAGLLCPEEAEILAAISQALGQS